MLRPLSRRPWPVPSMISAPSANVRSPPWPTATFEHFRPKAGYQQSPEDDLHKPGYYWLAYEWSNLLFSCQICNQQGKKNLFPLANPRRRACSHRDEVAAEKPLLIDPAQQDPERFIGFRQEVAFPRNRQRTGKVTIEVLGLNREALREKRRDYLAPLLELKKQRELLRRLIAERGDACPLDLVARLHIIDGLFVDCRQDSAEFAAMVASRWISPGGSVPHVATISQQYSATMC